MNSFSTLLDNPVQRPPEDVQIEAKNQFSVFQSHLSARHENSPIRGGTFIVLGVATYSLLDLALLDEINDRFDCWSQRGIQIEVFDVLQCHSQEDFAKFISGFAQPVHQTPVVAVWIKKLPQVVVTGEHAARTLLTNYHVLAHLA